MQAGTAVALPRATVTGRNRVAVFGIGRGDLLVAPIQRVFGPRIVFGSDLPMREVEAGVDFAIVVEAQGDTDAFLAAAARAFQSGIACLGVRILCHEVLIGPLAIPARAGCVNCARERMLAAAAPPNATPSRRRLRRTCRLWLRYLRANFARSDSAGGIVAVGGPRHDHQNGYRSFLHPPRDPVVPLRRMRRRCRVPQDRFERTNDFRRASAGAGTPGTRRMVGLADRDHLPPTCSFPG